MWWFEVELGSTLVVVAGAGAGAWRWRRAGQVLGEENVSRSVWE